MAAAGFRLAAPALLCASCTSVYFDQRSFDGTHWHVAAVDGQDTPLVDSYRIDFANGRIAARFGCNSFGGSYRVSRNQLVVEQLVGTLMGCPSPAGDFENRATAVLRNPMQIGRNPKKTVGTLLSNAAGSIELAPIVTGTRL